MGSVSAAGAARDAAFVKEKYESQWSGIEENLNRVAAEEGRNLARILNRCLDFESQVPNVFQDRYRRRCRSRARAAHQEHEGEQGSATSETLREGGEDPSAASYSNHSGVRLRTARPKANPAC